MSSLISKIASVLFPKPLQPLVDQNVFNNFVFQREFGALSEFPKEYFYAYTLLARIQTTRAVLPEEHKVVSTHLLRFFTKIIETTHEEMEAMPHIRKNVRVVVSSLLEIQKQSLDKQVLLNNYKEPICFRAVFTVMFVSHKRVSLLLKVAILEPGTEDPEEVIEESINVYL